MGNDDSPQNFGEISQYLADLAGVWPYSCDKLIACNDVSYQTCGCKNSLGTEDLAIVYNFNVTGEIIELLLNC